MAGRGECRAVADFEQDAGSGPDSDAGHRGQDLGKRVIVEHPLDVLGDLFALQQNRFQRVGEFRESGFGGLGAGNGDCLGGQRGQDVLDQTGTHARGVFGGDGGEFASARCADSFGSAAAGQDFQDRRMGDARAQDPFESGMDTGQQTADAVAGAGCFTGEVVIEPNENTDRRGERWPGRKGRRERAWPAGSSGARTANF